MASGRKSSSIRYIFGSVRPWAKPRQCIKLNQDIPKTQETQENEVERPKGEQTDIR